MKITLTIVSFCILFACATSQSTEKDAVETVEKVVDKGEDAVAESTIFTGMVIAEKTACGTIISMKKEGVDFKFYPVNLPQEFTKSGIKISFSMNPSRAKSPENCSLPVYSIEDVTLIK